MIWIITIIAVSLIISSWWLLRMINNLTNSVIELTDALDKKINEGNQASNNNFSVLYTTTKSLTNMNSNTKRDLDKLKIDINTLKK